MEITKCLGINNIQANEHQWHNHNGVISGIFYLELLEKELTTQFYDLKNRKYMNF